MTESKLKQEKSHKSAKLSNYDRSNFISQIFCFFIFPFLYRNYGKSFDFDAIDTCPKGDQCERLGSKFKKYWNLELVKHRAGQGASLLLAIIKCFGWQFLGTNFNNFLVYGIFRMGMPMILGRIIFYSNQFFNEKIITGNDTICVLGVENKEPDLLNQHFHLSNRENVILYSTFLALLIFLNLCVSHPNYFAKSRYGMNVRVAVTRLVYEKALKLTNQSVQTISAGKIVNLVSNDANRFENAYSHVEFLYTAIVETAIGMYFMYQYIGRSCFGILAIVLVYIPFQVICANVLNKFRQQSIVLTDNRLRLMSEIFTAMRVIKMYVWEAPFSALGHRARKLEIGKIRNSMMLRAVNLAIDFVAPKVMAFCCLILFVLDDGKLNAENVFVTMALIAQLRDIITTHFPMGITFGVEAYVSVKRIEKFLLEDEIDENHNNKRSDDQKCLNPRIILKQVNAKIKETKILKDISFTVNSNSLTVIIGSVGSGKSSILQAILRELPIIGQVNVEGRLIYVPQEAWIFSGTVRENILFESEFDLVKYRKVVQVSALVDDFKQFSDSDQTLVDDRGTSLSGGQRARISLARALYTDADCYLLDDPLSAVDASVAKQILEKCIKGHLKDKCVILVTHQVQFAKMADQIVVLKDGGCLACGSYDDIVKQGNMHFLNSKIHLPGIDIFKYSVTKTEIDQHQTNSTTNSPLSSPSLMRNTPNVSRIRSLSIVSIDNSISSDFDFYENHFEISTNKRLAQNLELNNNKIDKNKLKIYWIYIKAGAGIFLFSVFFISNLASQVLFTGSDYWLSVWTDYLGKSNRKNCSVENVNPIISPDYNTNIFIYSGLIIILFTFSFIRTFSFFTICMRASVNLHKRIFTSLLQAPILFFDKTPLGTILNRVSRDLGIIDDLLPPTAYEALCILFNSFGVFVLCTALNYLIVFPFLGLVVAIYFANRFYVDTARQVKRLEGIARSPLYNQVSSTLAGLVTIRSYGKEEMFLDRFSEIQNLHTSTNFTFLAASRFYGIFLELISVGYIYCFIVFMNWNLDHYTASLIGLTISQTLQLTNTFNFGIRLYTEVEMHMTSVERVNEFGNLEVEKLDERMVEPSESWPTKGDIRYDSVGLVYDENTQVLKNLTFSIKEGEKIGIVGRTGAGKSSLITTLFRLTVPTGSIWIDGINTGDISLSRLRRSLSIIPQEPILFSGDIRHNLDPFNQKSDKEIWDAISKVQLKSKIQSLPEMLSNPVSECGADFSVGQKQLICMARAILRKNPILILDEATANVDPVTDSLIQQTIRTEFAQCTVLTVAHRLNTIIDYDRVMVMEGGTIAQFDSPFLLIEQESGIFYNYLFGNLSQDTREELFKVAKAAHLQRHDNSQC